MASAFSHAVVGLAIGSCMYRPGIPKRTWVVGAFCSVFPDIDVIGFRFGVHYGDFWGHRGFTHSLIFAALLAGVVTFAVFWHAIPISRWYLWTYFFLATASHGVLDSMTDGGLGVAFFAPFGNRRYFLPWRPIRVSPIGVGRFFTERGIRVVESELLWIWLPVALVTITVGLFRYTRFRRSAKLT